ncbi:MAG: hypothetical protein R3B70_16335 [Polyangiaceae bacterium]
MRQSAEASDNEGPWRVVVMGSVASAFTRIGAVPVGDDPNVLVAQVSAGTVRIQAHADRFYLSTEIPNRSVFETTRSRGSHFRDASPTVVRANRPMRIGLTLQTDEDAAAVRSGVAREFQTGDTEFDQLIYLDTPCEDQSLRDVLNEAVRAAVLSLVALRTSEMLLRHLFIDDDKGRLLIEWTRPAGRHSIHDHWSPLTPDEARSMLDAFARLARDLPPIVSTGRRPWMDPQRRIVRVAQVLMLAGLFLTAFFVCRPLNSAKLERSFFVTFGAVALGTAAILMGLTWRFLRGRSNSVDTRQLAVAVAFWLSVEIGLWVAFLTQ